MATLRRSLTTRRPDFVNILWGVFWVVFLTTVLLLVTWR
jgi:hypothetical protein